MPDVMDVCRATSGFLFEALRFCSSPDEVCFPLFVSPSLGRHIFCFLSPSGRQKHEAVSTSCATVSIQGTFQAFRLCLHQQHKYNETLRYLVLYYQTRLLPV